MPAPVHPGAGTVLLASMPFSSAHFPNLALGLLKPLVEATGTACAVRYFSLDYMEYVAGEGGLPPSGYDEIAEVAIWLAQGGEWAFAAAADPRFDPDDLTWITDVLLADNPAACTPTLIHAFMAARAGAPAFIERCYASVDWAEIAVLGFTSSFQQTMASLALARVVRARQPHVTIVMGGANCQEEMGHALIAEYDCLDAVCVGEGERALPELVRAVRDGQPLAGIPGIATRETAAPPVERFPVEALPYPDFDDFFAQHARTAAARRYLPSVVFETARGCWWGAKHHCTFCGLNGTSMAYRSKSQGRAYDELTWLVDRHGCSDVANGDNILDMAYFQDFLPRLAASRHNLLIFYETKANLKPEHLTALAAAGVRKIQAGIETLDTRLLTLVRKGSTGLQNVQTLKLAAEAGVFVEWLALYGLPGEAAADYDRIAAMLPLLRHLQPPAAFIPTRGDRFSPYFNEREKFGVVLDPLPAYRHIYAGDPATHPRLGYHFVMRSPALAEAPRYTAACAGEISVWRAHQATSALWIENGRVHDRRHGWPATERVLDPDEAALMALAWQIVPWKRVLAEIGDGAAAAAERMQAAGWLLREGQSVLALPLRQPGFRRAPSIAEIRSLIGLELPVDLPVDLPVAAE